MTSPAVGFAGFGDPLWKPIRRLSVPENGGHFGWSLATLGDRLLVGAPNLDGAGTTDAHAYVIDPATGDVIHDLRVEVGDDRWWQFAVSTVEENALVGIAPGEETDRLGGSVTLFDGETGGTIRTFCCLGALSLGVGEHVLLGGEGGAALYDPATGNVIRTYTIADPERRGVLSLARVGRTLAIAAALPVGVHLFDERTGARIGFAGTNHGNARRFGSAMAVSGSRLAATEVPQVNVFDLSFGALLATIDSPPGFPRGTFGTSLAYVDGGLLAVGAPSASLAGGGGVHLFDQNHAFVTTLTADGVGLDFGRSITALGRSIAVGAPTEAGGTVVIFSPCGDGVVDTPVEQCDDGNDDPTDGCDGACRTTTAGGDVCGDADANGSATVTDGVLVLRAVAGLGSPCTTARCDVDGDGRIGVTDGVQVLRFAAGLPASLLCASDNARRMR